MYIKGCLPKSRGTCRTCTEDSLVWLLGSSWRGHGNSANRPSLRVGWSLLCCLSFDTWLLPKGRQREGETKWMATSVWHPAKKFGSKICHQNNLGSNGREETSPDLLLLTIKVTYIILKNKRWRSKPHKLVILTICIGFHCDMKPTSKTMVPWLVRTTLSTVLYETNVCMKLFNMTSPKFDERGGTI
jgi:hypothetical protein